MERNSKKDMEYVTVFANDPQMYTYIYLLRECGELEQDWMSTGGDNFPHHLHEMKRIIDKYLQIYG